MFGKQEITLQGRPLSPGLAEGQSYVYRDILQRDHRRYAINEADTSDELERIERAMERVLSDLENAAGHIERELDKSHADILRVQQAFIRDPHLLKEIKRELESELVNAEEVIKRVLRRMQRRLTSMESNDTRDPGDDVADLSRRLLRNLSGHGDHALDNLPSGSVIVARRLLPSQTVLLSRQSVTAVVLEEGGIGSHAALLTREMGLPAVSGIADATKQVVAGSSILVDGTHGCVTVNPTPDTEEHFQKILAASRVRHDRACSRCHETAATSEGTSVRVMANVGCREHVRLARDYGADGVGLYRLEEFYLAQQHPPTEDTLLETLEVSLAPLKDRSVTVRLLDAGGDKLLPFLDMPEERNPFLGQRGVRLLQAYPDITQTQLGALLTLSQKMDVRILIPMVSLPEDIHVIRDMLDTLAGERGVSSPPLGAMIETPVAAICADRMAEAADFLSVGTNDLTQYTMAADRENESVDRYYQDNHLSILYLIHCVSELCGTKPVSICGELAADTSVTSQLIDMGVRDLSVAPFLVPMIKEAVRSL
jgi:phosphoenolpyruvate-protein phosphotransferase